MPIVKVTWLEGRDKTQKDQVAKAITEVMVSLAKAKPEATTVVFEDVPRENWAKAGVLASEW